MAGVDPNVAGTGLSEITNAAFKTPTGIYDYFTPSINFQFGSQALNKYAQQQYAASPPGGIPVTSNGIYSLFNPTVPFQGVKALTDAQKQAIYGKAGLTPAEIAAVSKGTFGALDHAFTSPDVQPHTVTFNDIVNAVGAATKSDPKVASTDWAKKLASFGPVDTSTKALDYLKTIPGDALLGLTDYAIRYRNALDIAQKNSHDPLMGVLKVAGAALGFNGLSQAIAQGAASMTPGQLISSALDKIGNIGSSVGSAISHPLDTIVNALSTAGDLISHPVDTITNGILGTQSPAPIVDHSINIPTDNIFAGGGFNGTGPLTSLAGSGGNTGVDNLVASAIGGQTPIMGIGTGALANGQTIGGSQAALSNINVPTQAANKATNALSNVAQNLATNALTSALTDTPTQASDAGILGAQNQFRPGLLGVNYPALKSVIPFYKGRVGLLGSFI